MENQEFLGRPNISEVIGEGRELKVGECFCFIEAGGDWDGLVSFGECCSAIILKPFIYEKIYWDVYRKIPNNPYEKYNENSFYGYLSWLMDNDYIGDIKKISILEHNKLTQWPSKEA